MTDESSDEFSWTGRRAGYSMVPNQFWNVHPDASATVMLGWLWSHEQQYLRKLNVSRVASALGWTRDRVTRALALLANDGWLTVTTERPNMPTRRTVVHLDGDKQRLWISDAIAGPRCTETTQSVVRKSVNSRGDSVQHKKNISEKNNKNAAGAELFISGAGAVDKYVPPPNERAQSKKDWRGYVPTIKEPT